MLGGVWGLVFGDSLWQMVSGVISGEVLGMCVRVAIERQVASVSSWVFSGSKGVSEFSSSDPQWSGSGGGIGERGGLRVMWLLS